MIVAILALVFSVLFIFYSRNTGHSFWLVWSPFFLAAAAFLLGIPVYNQQRGHMTEPEPVPPYPMQAGDGGASADPDGARSRQRERIMSARTLTRCRLSVLAVIGVLALAGCGRLNRAATINQVKTTSGAADGGRAAAATAHSTASPAHTSPARRA